MHRKPPADPPPGRVRDHGFGVEYGGGSDWGLGFGTDPELVEGPSREDVGRSLSLSKGRPG